MITIRTSRKNIHRIAANLSQRDFLIIRFVRMHRFATTTQIRRRFFTNHASQPAAARACMRVLDRLYTQRILARLERRIGGVQHGSSAFIWCLDVVGDRLTKERGSPRKRAHEPSSLFLDHTLAISETHVQLSEAEEKGIFELRDIAIETGAWRGFVSATGVRTILKPDLKITISGSDYDDHWYLEIDRGTESLPVLIRKCRIFEEYRRTGRAQSEHGVFPRVLWVLPDTGRMKRLGAAIDKEADLPDGMFTCITADAFIGTLCDPP